MTQAQAQEIIEFIRLLRMGVIGSFWLAALAVIGYLILAVQFAIVSRRLAKKSAERNAKAQQDFQSAQRMGGFSL